MRINWILTGILPKCIAFLIHSQQIENVKQGLKRSQQKLHALKNYISRFYNYTTQETTSDIVEELMTALKGKYIFRVSHFYKSY